MAKIKSSNEIYDVIESALNDTPRAVTAAELMERPEVRRSAYKLKSSQNIDLKPIQHVPAKIQSQDH